MKKITLNKALIAILLTLMFLPIINGISNAPSKIHLAEKRKLVKKPVKINGGAFNSFLNDNFGTRQILILFRNQLKYSVFHDSPNKRHAVLGKEDWLFYKPKALDDYRGIDLYSKEELESIKKINEARQKWLNERGIKFYITIAPNKHSIYPECMPDYIKKASEGKYAQLKKFIEKETSLKLIDLHEPIIKAKEQYKNKEDILYNKYDTHWSDLGAFVANQKLIQEIGKDFPVILKKNKLILDDFEYKFCSRINKNIAGQMQLITPVVYESKEFVFKKAPKASIVKPYSYKGFRWKQRQGFWVKSQNDSTLPSVVVFRDSFYTRLEKFFSEYFNKCVYVWKNDSLRLDIIEAEKPDIVVLEIVERLKDQLNTKHYSSEQIVGFLKEIETRKLQGEPIIGITNDLGFPVSLYHIWKQEYKKLNAEQAKTIKTL